MLAVAPLLSLILLLLSPPISIANSVKLELIQPSPKAPNLGAILDLSSRGGREAKVGLEIALEDCYLDERQRPVLLVQDSQGDPIVASSFAESLIRKQQVRVIIGPGTWQETTLVAEIGNRSRVPILSLPNQFPTWSSSNSETKFLVNLGQNQLAETNALASIVRSWQWRRVNIIYEDTYGFSIPFLVTSLQDVSAQVSELLPLPRDASIKSLSQKLKYLRGGQCRVFVVHASSDTALQIFVEAKRLQMVDSGFVWIVTSAVANLIDTFNRTVISSMQGVLGIRSYTSHYGKPYQTFQAKFKTKFSSMYPEDPYPEPGLDAFQAYDALQAVTFAMKDAPWSGGENLRSNILASNFQGLSGRIRFNKYATLTPARVFRVVNIAGNTGYMELGYWTDGLGFSKRLGRNAKLNSSMVSLGQVIWPGRPSGSAPTGWTVPSRATPLRIGVPTRNTHKEFVDVTYGYPGSKPIVTGFTIDVFNATLNYLPYYLPHEFVPYNGTYDELIQQVYYGKFEAVVGDTGIVAERYAYAEFSQPYTETGLQMLVYVRPTRVNRAWLIKKPFTTTLWVAIGAINVFNGFVLWFIDRKRNPAYRGASWLQQIGIVLSSAFITLFSLKANGMYNTWARFVMAAWLGFALVITQSYTASLSSFLTLQQLPPNPIDLDTLRRTGAKVGCDARSFLVNYLNEGLLFPPEKIVQLQSEDDYRRALMKGEIMAAFIQIAHLKIFLVKNCNGFMTSGPIYKVGGFGFVFPKNSLYLPDISEAVLKVAEKGQLNELETALTSKFKCTSTSDSSDDHGSLGATSFLALFLITVGMSTIAFLRFFLPPALDSLRRRYKWLAKAKDRRQPRNQQQLELQDWRINNNNNSNNNNNGHDPLADEHLLFAHEMDAWQH